MPLTCRSHAMHRMNGHWQDAWMGIVRAHGWAFKERDNPTHQHVLINIHERQYPKRENCIFPP